MERVKPSRPCAIAQTLSILDKKKIENFNLPLTNFDFMKLHSIFMQPINSNFQVADILKGRIIVQKVLKTLNYYENVGCLTTAEISSGEVTHIFKIIKKYAQVYGLEYAINQFFIEYIHLDFIWIELTQDLIKQFGKSNIHYFIKIMNQYESIPIVIIQYDNN